MLGPMCNNGCITFRNNGLLHLGLTFITFRIFITFKVARNSFLGMRGLGRWLRVLAQAHQAHAGANLAILYTRKFCKIYISIENISESWRWKFVKFGTVVKNRQKFLFWSKEKIL